MSVKFICINYIKQQVANSQLKFLHKVLVRAFGYPIHAVNLKHLGHFLEMHMHFARQHTVSLHKDAAGLKTWRGEY